MNKTALFFLLGFFGSISVEVVDIFQILKADQKLPERYKRPLFWTVRILIATIGGGLAMAYEVQSNIAAIAVGASAPLTFKGLAENTRLLTSTPGGPPRDTTSPV